MKKLSVIIAACILAACSQPPSTPAAPASAIPTGSFDAFGANPEFEFIADTSANALELRMDYETAASASYSPPQPTADGAQIVSGDLTVDLVAIDCIVNDTTYPLRVTVQARGQAAVTGCGIERWDTHLKELMPYIDACIAKSPETRWVTYARRSGDEITVRLSGESVIHDCVAQNGNPQSARSHQSNDTVHPPGDSVAIFVRAPGAQPGGQCYDAPEVRNDSGELLGWMADPLGC